MLHIAFDWTSAAAVVKRKRRTRRDWTEVWAAKFHAGRQYLGLDHNYRVGGQPIVLILLTAEPSWEPLSTMPDEDYEREGFAWLYEHPAALPAKMTREDVSWAAFNRWRSSPECTWVVDFEVVEVYATVDPEGRLILPKPRPVFKRASRPPWVSK